MRQATQGDYTIVYPEELTFAFKPILITAETSGLGVSLETMDVEIMWANGTIINTYDARYYALARQSTQGTAQTYTATADISAFVQALFPIRTQYIDTITVTLTLKGVTEETFTFTINSVWGAEDYGGADSFFALRDIRWWPAFPFTLGVYMGASGVAAFSVGGTVALNEGITEIVPPSSAAENIMAYSVEGGIIQSTFDNTFDITFQNAGGTVLGVARLHVCDCDKGIYLRWVNRHGFYAYWLFKDGAEQHTIEAEKTFTRADFGLYSDTYGFRDGAGLRQAMRRGDTLAACATLVNRKTFDYLQDLTTSPLVDMYMGQDENDEPIWMAVSIQSGTWTETTDELQDFEINIIKPFTPVQRL